MLVKARGVGKPGVITIAPTIASAMYNAVGVQITESPIALERSLNTLKTRPHH